MNNDRALTELRAAVVNLANATARVVDALDVLERCGCHCAACEGAAPTGEQATATVDEVPPAEAPPQTVPGARPVGSMGYWEVFG